MTTLYYFDSLNKMLKKSQHDRDWCVNIRNIKHQLYFDTFCLLLCFYFKEKITVCTLNCQIITYLLGSLGELLLSSFLSSYKPSLAVVVFSRCRRSCSGRTLCHSQTTVPVAPRALPRLLPRLPPPSLPLHWAARKSQDGWRRLEVTFPSATWSRERGRKRGRHHRAFIFIFF